jgi:hypothetical protein
MAIIGINGKIGSGKDTVGSMIRYFTSECSNLNGGHFRTYLDFMERGQGNNDFQTWYNSDWEVKKFAGKLKKVASLLTGIPVSSFEDQEFKKSFLPDEWSYLPTDEIMTDGIGLGFKKMTVRELLQKMGTDALRDHLHTNVWVNALFADYEEDSKWVITDLRFPNEYDSVKAWKGITVRVTRPGTEVGTHPSEIALDEFRFDWEIVNDGDLAELFEKVKIFMQHYSLV